MVPSPPRLTARSRPAASLSGSHPRSTRSSASASVRGRRTSWPCSVNHATASLATRSASGRSRCTTSAIWAISPAPQAGGLGYDRLEVDGLRQSVDAEVDQELDVALGSSERRDHGPNHDGIVCRERVTDLLEHAPPHLRIADDPPTAGRLGPPGLELRLDQGDE